MNAVANKMTTDEYSWLIFPALSIVSGSMLGKLLFFLAGTYAGIYLDQRYQLPKADDPKELWAKLQEYASQHKKEPGSKDS